MSRWTKLPGSSQIKTTRWSRVEGSAVTKEPGVVPPRSGPTNARPPASALVTGRSGVGPGSGLLAQHPLIITNETKILEDWTFKQWDLMKDRIDTGFDLVLNRHVSIHLGLLDSIQVIGYWEFHYEVSFYQRCFVTRAFYEQGCSISYLKKK